MCACPLQERHAHPRRILPALIRLCFSFIREQAITHYKLAALVSICGFDSICHLERRDMRRILFMVAAPFHRPLRLFVSKSFESFLSLSLRHRNSVEAKGMKRG